MSCVQVVVAIFLLISIAPLARGESTHLNSVACDALFAGISGGASDSSTALTNYLNLVRSLAEANTFTAEDIRSLVKVGHPVNPLNVVDLQLSSAKHFSFSQAFDHVLPVLEQNDATWNTIREEYLSLLAAKETGDTQRVEAKSATQGIFFPISLKKIDYASKLGEVRAVLTLKDGRPAVITEEPGLTLYDLQKGTRTEIALAGHVAPRIRTFRSKNGINWLVTVSGSNRVQLYRIGDEGEIIELPGSTFRNEELSVVTHRIEGFSENKKGEPVAVIGLTKKNGGFQRVEFNFVTKAERILSDSIANHKKSSVVVTGDAQVLRLRPHWRSLAFENATSAVLQDIKWPRSFNKPFLGSLLAPSQNSVFLFDRAEDKFFGINLSDQKIYDYSFSLASAKNPVIVFPTDDGFETQVNGYSPFDSVIAVINGENRIYELPVGRLERVRAKILKLRSGLSFLIVASGDRGTPINVLKLNSWEGYELKLDDKESRWLVDAYESTDGRVIGVFNLQRGFEAIQLYGPPVKGEP